jgi:hypothetical protein
MENYRRVTKLKDFDLNRTKNKEIDYLGIKIKHFYQRVEKLQRECFIKEKEEKQRHELKKAEANRVQMDTSNLAFSKIKQMATQFFRDSTNKSKKSQEFLNQRKLNIDNANRAIEGNRIKNYLQKVMLKNVSAKSKIDNKRDCSYDEIKELISKARNNYLLHKKNRKFIRVSLSPSKNENVTHNESMTSTDDLKRVQRLFQKKIKHKKHSRSLYHHFLSSQTSSFICNNTSLSGHPNQQNSLRDIMLKNKANRIKINKSEISSPSVNKHHRSKVHSFQMKPLVHSQSCESHLTPKVLNQPLIVTKIEDIINDYKHVKSQIKKERNLFLKRQFLSRDEIKKLMDVREEMRIMKIKEKYLRTKFPEKKEKTQQYFSDFVSEIGELLDAAENKFYLRKKNEYNAFQLDAFFKQYSWLK